MPGPAVNLMRKAILSDRIRSASFRGRSDMGGRLDMLSMICEGTAPRRGLRVLKMCCCTGSMGDEVIVRCCEEANT